MRTQVSVHETRLVSVVRGGGAGQRVRVRGHRLRSWIARHVLRRYAATLEEPPRYHAEEDERGARIQIDLPGFRPSDIEVRLHAQRVSIRARCAAEGPGSAERFAELSFPLGRSASAKRARADLIGSRLELRLPWSKPG